MITVWSVQKWPVLANKHKMQSAGGHLGNLVLELNKEDKEEEEEEEGERVEGGRGGGEEGKEVKQ